MKKKKTASRRRSALRRAGLLVIVLLVLLGTGEIKVHPAQTLPTLLQHAGLDPTEIIHIQPGESDLMKGKQLLVSTNEDFVVLSEAKLSWNGWSQGNIGTEIRFEEPDDRHFVWTREVGGHESEWVCLFGFVPTGEKAPTYLVGVEDERGSEDGNGYYQTAEEYPLVVKDRHYFLEMPRSVTPTPTIPVKGGMCYLEQYEVSLAPYGYEVADVRVLMEIEGEWDLPVRWMHTVNSHQVNSTVTGKARN